MNFDAILKKYTTAVSAASSRIARIPRRNGLYKGDGKIVNKTTGKEVQAECHQNIVFEMIESQISNTVPEPLVTPYLAGDSQRALAATNYLSMAMRDCNGIEINDRAERGTLKNGYHFYLIEWDQSLKRNSGFGGLRLREFAASNVYTQPGITDFKDSEYVFIKSVATVGSIKRTYHVDVEPDAGTDVCTIVTCYYLNDDGDLGRTIFAEKSRKIISQDDYYELRRVLKCDNCGELISNPDNPCSICGSNNFRWEVLEEETAYQDIYEGDIEKNAEERARLKASGQPDDPTIGLTKIVSVGDKIPFYHVRELPVVMRVSISSDDSIFGLSDIDMIEQNQDTLNRITTKEEENLLKAGSFVTYPSGVNVPADDSTLKLIPIEDPRLIDAFSVQTIQANMQKDDIYATRMYQYGRANLGITESYQGKKDTTATSGKAKQLAAAQSAGRLESKQRMKVQAYSEIYRKMFKFLLAYADETQYYVKQDSNGDLLQLTFNRYNFLKKDSKTGQLYWDDNFIVEADNASLIGNKAEMWQTLTQQLMSGSLGAPADPAVLKLYWEIMKQLQFPFAAAIHQNLLERQNDLSPELKQFIMQNPNILQMLAQLQAQQNHANKAGAGQPSLADAAVQTEQKQKPGPSAQQAPEPANAIPEAEMTTEDKDAED
jgi:hypothetical protein